MFSAERCVAQWVSQPARAAWGSQMKNYSIVRIGNEYVVQADDQSVLKIASRRRAARLVTCAAELMDSQPAPPMPSEAREEPSGARDPRKHT
jgi:hypothetical protein